MKKLLLFCLVIPVLSFGQIPVRSVEKNIFSMDTSFTREALSKGYFISFNRWMRAADLNKDGKMDLVLQAYQHSNRGGILAVLLNQSTSSNTRYVNSFTGNLYTEGDPGLFDVGDVNGDQLPDILVPTQNYHGEPAAKESSWYPDGGDHSYDKLFLNKGTSFKKILFPDNYNTESARLLNIRGDKSKEILVSNYSKPQDTDPRFLDRNLLYRYELIDEQLHKRTTFRGDDTSSLFIRIAQSEEIGDQLFFVLNHYSRNRIDSISVISFALNDSLSVYNQPKLVGKIIPRQVRKGDYTYSYSPVIDFGVHIADLNKDGRYEVVTHEFSQIKNASGANVEVDIGIAHTRIQVYDKTGNISDQWLDQSIQYDPLRVAHGNGISLADFNGDGLPDILPVNGWGWWRWDNGDPAIRKELEHKRILLNTGSSFKSFSLAFANEGDLQRVKSGAFFYPLSSLASGSSDILYINEGSAFSNWENTNGVIKLDFSQFKFPCETNKPAIQLAESFSFCSTTDSLVLRSGAAAGMSVRWYRGDTLISSLADLTVKSSVLLRLVVTNLGGCSGEKSINVTRIGSPAAGITASGSTTITQTGNVVLSTNTGTGLTYQWFRDGLAISNATSSSFTASSGGSYTVRVSNASGCETLSAPLMVNRVFMLPVNNYQVSTEGETCRTSDNGRIRIAAVQNLSYTATLSRAGQVVKTANFSSSAELSGLSAGTYSLCISIAAEADYKQCYELSISEPQDLSVYTQLNPVSNTVALNMSGSDSYTITHNGKTYTSQEARMSLALQPGWNIIQVNTSKACQGSYTEEIYMNEHVEVFPNPFSSMLNLKIQNQEGKELLIRIHNSSGNTVYQGMHRVHNNLIKLDLSQIDDGYYFVIIGKQSYKVIKH